MIHALVRRRASLVAGGLVLLGAGCRFSDDFVTIGRVTTTVEAAGIERLDLNDPVGSVHVVPARDDRFAITADVSVRRSLQAQFPTADLTRDLRIGVEGATLRIANAHQDQEGDGHGDDFSAATRSASSRGRGTSC